MGAAERFLSEHQELFDEAEQGQGQGGAGAHAA
jgi:hypothetical protein